MRAPAHTQTVYCYDAQDVDRRRLQFSTVTHVNFLFRASDFLFNSLIVIPPSDAVILHTHARNKRMKEEEEEGEKL